MSEPTIDHYLKQYFPEFKDPGLIEEIKQHAKLMQVEADTVIMDVGSYIKVIPLVMEGAIKVLREDAEGNELFLYYLYPGQTCAMSMNCCMIDTPSQVKAVAEYDTTYLSVPARLMDAWVKKYDSWKNFIITTYSDRFNELLNTIDSIAFLNMDERLVNYLLDKSAANNTNTLKVTHQQIAYDLHSSREVISRLLKGLEKRKKIKLGRNKIELLELV